MKKQYVLLISIISLLLVTIGASYAFFWATSTPGSITASGAAKLLGNIDFVDGQSVVTPVDGIYPGWIGVQKFHINKPSDVNEGVGTYEVVMETNVDSGYSDWVSYEIYKTTNSSDTIIRVEGELMSNPDNQNEIYINDSLTTTGFNVPNGALKKGVINSSSGTISLDTQSFDLATWEDTTYYIVYRFNEVDVNQNSAQGKSFNTIIDVNLTSSGNSNNVYVDASGANAPELDSKMIPILIEEGTGTITIADTSKEWYNYNDSEWANAVIVDSTFTTLDPGVVIPMDKIEQMYVWIPRYEYSKSSIETPTHSVEVSFVNVNEVNTDIENSDVIIHPAFTFGNDELAGIWVGKFENSWDDGYVDNSSDPDFNNNVSTTYIIKPNVNSVHDTNVSTMYDNVNNAMTSYSLDASTDVHMMKNTEWGAVAYLSQSKYGICFDDIYCTSNGLSNGVVLKVASNSYYIDGTIDIVTGCGGSDVSVAGTCPANNTWTTSNGIKASSTHNITGIYDMAGGRTEYMMAVVKNSDNVSINYSLSGFTSATMPSDAKYYDLYDYGTTQDDMTAFSRGLIGDATVELFQSGNSKAYWNDDYAYFVYYIHHWFRRGGSANISNSSGVWAFHKLEGLANNATTSRSVLILNK